MFIIWSKGFRINFQNRKWNYPNRKWNYFSTFQASDPKTSFTKYFSLDPRGSKLFSKQEMELFLHLQGLWSKNFFYIMFLIWSNGLKINFQNRKWYYPNRKWYYFSTFQAYNQKRFFYKMFLFWSKGLKINFQNRKWNYPNRKWNYFSMFQTSDKKISFTKCFSLDPRGLKLISISGNGIIQTGNGIISPPSRPLIKKLLLQNVSHLVEGFQN